MFFALYFCINAFGLPSSTIFPASMTSIRSALTIVESLCAITMAVRPARCAFIPLWIACSVQISIELVASSRIKIFGFASRALAKLTSWRSPSESFEPLSPTSVSNPSSRLSKSRLAPIASVEARISSSVASGFPYRRFSRIVPEKRKESCGIIESQCR